VTKIPTTLLVDFGNTLRNLRRSRNLSQEELGHLAGLDRTYISGLERGKRNPTLKVIVRIAACLETTTSDFLEGLAIIHDKDN
jgi:transcriptional regulator with XRE-family HTH domain